MPDSPSQLFAENTISSIRKRFTADDPYSQDVAKQVFGAILENGELGFRVGVAYTNNRRRKSSTRFRQRCLAFFP